MSPPVHRQNLMYPILGIRPIQGDQRFPNAAQNRGNEIG